MTSVEIINLIKSNGVENEVLEYLVKDRIRYLKKLESDCSMAGATIGCIKATNKGKNEAIDALCEPETDKEKRSRYFALGIYY